MGCTGRLQANQTAHKQFSSYSRSGYLPGQFPGEHIGGGAPPTANEEVDTAPSSTRVASIKRTIFFMRSPRVGWSDPTRRPYGFWSGESEVFEKRAVERCCSSVNRQFNLLPQIRIPEVEQTFRVDLTAHRGSSESCQVEIAASPRGESSSVNRRSCPSFHAGLLRKRMLMRVLLLPGRHVRHHRHSSLASPCGSPKFGRRRSAGLGSVRDLCFRPKARE